MKYTLLTGATGLLGRYLMRDLLMRNAPVAVLARDSKFDKADARIDAVLAHWEEQWRRALPRPVILNGDIRDAGLGMPAEQREWVERNCDSMFHVAASLTFQEKGDEPRRSNVEGVRNVLDFCEATDIGILRHVSSSYICGLRTGRVFENELNLGQRFGNIYEETKAEGEEMVRAAGFLQAYTIFRPTIIVGDSETGFTSNYHGFYAPLRPLSVMSAYLSHEEVFALNHMENLGLKGHERKNFVPVQWVSDAMLTILERRADDNTTYALASDDPVNVLRTYELFQEAVRRFPPPALTGGNSGTGRTSEKKSPQMEVTSPEVLSMVAMYLERLDVYRNHWRDDPVFDNSNTRQVIPDKPAPALTDEQVLRLCKFAIDSDFAWKPPRLPGDRFVARQAISGVAGLEVADAPAGSMSLTITGVGGGTWTISGGDRLRCEPGRLDSTTEVRIGAAAFADLWHGRLSVPEAISSARVLVTGDQKAVGLLEAIIHAGAEAAGCPGATSE